MIELYIKGVKGEFMPVICNEVVWTTQKWGAGVLNFSVIKEGSIDFKEGNHVYLRVNGKNIFYGYVFSKSRNKDGIIAVTCYDQLRYLRNKDTYTYVGKKASQVLSMICDDYRLNKGNIVDTGFIIGPRVEDNSTLFDIIYNAINITRVNTGRSFILYDDFGKIALVDSNSMKTNLLINERSSIDFDYNTTIDKGVYNSIKLVHQKNTKYIHVFNVYTAKDEGLINDWGMLRHFEHINEDVNGNEAAKGMLNMYKTKNRYLSIKTAGNINIRAGSFVNVNLDIGDFLVNESMQVNTCRQIFSDNNHIMEVEVVGGVLNE